MKDRVVQYPHRYQLVPVAGESDTYDIIAKPGTITEVGTPLNKATLLSDATAALYGLTGDDATVDSVLKIRPANLTLFRIPTTEKNTGIPVVGIVLKLVSETPPTETLYTTNDSGYLDILLPYGTYTLTSNGTYIEYKSFSVTLSSNSGEVYKTIPPFIESRPSPLTITTSGTYITTKDKLDLFLVGGGGGGQGAYDDTSHGGGGGGGYVKNVYNQPVTPNTPFQVIIGAGGAGGALNGGAGGDGGATSVLGHSVNGGKGAASYNGGNGGSGGGAGSGASGGSNGSNGVANNNRTAGIGAGVSTMAFGGAISTIKYSAGGGSGGGGLGGADGGGNGGAAWEPGSDATNYGGGGGGGGGKSGKTGPRGGAGMQGLVIVRWS